MQTATLRRYDISPCAVTLDDSDRLLDRDGKPTERTLADLRDEGFDVLIEATEEEDELPQCVLAMQCYCAGHARGNPASAPCDTTE